MGLNKVLLGLVILSVILTTACSNSTPTKDMGELYSLALDSYMPIDKALNSGMKYIAIDMSNFKDIDETDKNQILNYFEKYNVEVMEATYEQLIEKGLNDPQSLVLHGVLLRVEKTDISKNRIVIEGSKYRSGTGAIGTKIVIDYKNGKWQITKTEGTWES